MRVLAFNGSPKAKGSNTDVMIQAFLQGSRRAGADTEDIYLIEKTIHHCKGCFHCWFKAPGRCIYHDDMGELIEKYKNADIVCFATPVYTWNMTALLKNFIDRLAPLKSPLLVRAHGNFDLKDTETKNTLFVAMANAGFPGENNFDTIGKVFSSCNPVLEIYRNCGMALKKEDERVKNYLKFVSLAGFELAANRIVSEETKGGLLKEMIPTAEYVQMLGM